MPLSRRFQDFQRLADDCVAPGALDMGDKAHTACVMLVAPVVKALGLRKSHRVATLHHIGVPLSRLPRT